MDIKVSVCEEHTLVVSSCDTQDKSGLQVAARKLARGTQTSNTLLVWIDGAWSGRVALCKSISAGAVRLRVHATETSKVDRWETLDHRRKQDHRIGAYPETRAEDVAERAVQAVGEVPDTIDKYEKDQGETLRSSQSARIVDAEGRDCSREEDTGRRGDYSGRVCVCGSRVARRRASRQGI